ncbi:hypothetical protein GQR58_029446 [Nymphon striatum]|nr:hypothetical protein GQR58_029446 [Nymphon striatum]
MQRSWSKLVCCILTDDRDAAKEGKITSGNGIEFANYIEPNLPHKIEDKEKFLSNLAAVLKAANGKDILYSSEFISFKNPDRAQKLANVAQKNGYTMKYILLEQGLVNRSLSTTEAEMLRYLNSIPMGTPRVIGRVTHELSQINNEILDTKTQEAPNAGFAENQAQFLEDRFEDTLKIVNAHIKGQKISSDLDSTKMLQLETMTEVEKTLLVLIAGLISRI